MAILTPEILQQYCHPSTSSETNLHIWSKLSRQRSRWTVLDQRDSTGGKGLPDIPAGTVASEEAADEGHHVPEKATEEGHDPRK